MKIQIINLSADKPMIFSLIVEDKGIYERNVRISPGGRHTVEVPEVSKEAE